MDFLIALLFWFIVSIPVALFVTRIFIKFDDEV